jgi:hypothetical protein
MNLCAITCLTLLATVGCSGPRSEGSRLSVTSFGPRNMDAAGVDVLDAAWGSNTKTTDVHGEAVNNCGLVIGDAFVESPSTMPKERRLERPSLRHRT